MNESAKILQDPARRLSPIDPEAAPAGPGIYAWWVRDDLVAEELALTARGASHPLYVGLAQKSLRGRLAEHLRPIHEGRTEFHGGVAEWLSQVAHSVPWTPRLMLDVTRYGEERVLYRWAESAIATWMRLALSLSWVELPTRDAAARAEAEAITALKPLFNGGRTRGAIWDPEQEDLVQDDVREARIDLLIARDWLYWALFGEDLSTIAAGDRAWVAVGDGARPIGGVRHDEPPPPPALVAELPCAQLAESREELLLVKPHEWYSTVWRQLYGDPPGWEQVVDDMTERERRALVLLDHVQALIEDASAAGLWVHVQLDEDEGPLVGHAGGCGRSDLRNAAEAIGRYLGEHGSSLPG